MCEKAEVQADKAIWAYFEMGLQDGDSYEASQLPNVWFSRIDC